MTKRQRAARMRLIKVLHSGKYPLGRGRLRSPVGYCCLGIGCDLHNPKLWGKWDGEYSYHDLYSTVWPHHVAVRYGYAQFDVAQFVGRNDDPSCADPHPQIAMHMHFLTLAGL